MTDRQYAAKEWLNKAYRLSKTELKIKEEYAEKCKPDDGAVDCSKDRIQNSSSASAQEERLLTYAMACEAVDKVKAKIERIKRSRQKVIDMVPNDDYRILLTLRYLLNKPWKEVAKDMNYSVSHLINKHREALNEVYDYIKEGDDDE